MALIYNAHEKYFLNRRSFHPTTFNNLQQPSTTFNYIQLRSTTFNYIQLRSTTFNHHSTTLQPPFNL